MITIAHVAFEVLLGSDFGGVTLQVASVSELHAQAPLICSSHLQDRGELCVSCDKGAVREAVREQGTTPRRALYGY